VSVIHAATVDATVPSASVAGRDSIIGQVPTQELRWL
jgi:hypothetical protein